MTRRIRVLTDTVTLLAPLACLALLLWLVFGA